MKKMSVVLFLWMAVFVLSLPVYAMGSNRDQQEAYGDYSSIAELKDVDAIYKKTESILRKEQVSEKQIKNLIEKLKRSEPWDAFKPEYADLVPQIQTPHYTKTIFPDGSYIVESIEDVAPIQTRGIITKRSVRISKTNGLVSAEFYMDYQRNTSTGKARVLSMYNRKVVTMLGTVSDIKYGHWDDWRNPTNAWMSFICEGLGGSVGGFCWLKGYANGNGHWVKHSY